VSGRPLEGRRVVTTRDERGRLDSLLARAGADVVHVPLIEIVDLADGGAALRDALGTSAGAAWLVVTSRHGAARVAPVAAAHPSVRLAAVGARTARVLGAGVGRPVDVVPAVETAAGLLAVMPPPETPDERLVLAQADLADGRLATGLQALGYAVTAVTAYSTRARVPTAAERAAVSAADAVVFASGSAATSWVTAIGTVTPDVVVAIGPTTRTVAERAGLQITHVATDHNVDGLVATVIAAFRGRP
jgi:uroporphyrinogen-III synthase